MTTIHWTLTLGLQEGYHTRQQEVPALSQIGSVYQEIAEELYQETNIYISASIFPAHTLYRTEWGCPDGGEETVVLMGCCNPAFAHPKGYEAVLRKLAERLKKRFHQRTILLEILSAQGIYFTDDGEGRV